MQLEFRIYLCAILVLLLMVTGCEADDERHDAVNTVETPVEAAPSETLLTDVTEPKDTVGTVESESTGDDSNEAAEVSEEVEDEIDESGLQDWNRHQSSVLGLSFSYPDDWQTLNEFDGTLFLSNLDAMAAGRGPELSQDSIFLTMYPHVDLPPVEGYDLTIGQQDYPATIIKSDPWGYREPDLTVDVFYSANDINWLIRAQFSEPANSENELYLDLQELLQTVQHHDLVVDPVPSVALVELYDQVTAYWDRIHRDTVSLIQDRQSINEQLSVREWESESWRNDFERSLAQWDPRYFDALLISPPQGLGGVHARYLRAHFYHEVLRLILYDWMEGNPGSRESHLGALSASLAAMNLTLLYSHSPNIYGATEIENSIRDDVAILPRWGTGLFHDFLIRHFGEDDSLWTLARLHLRMDDSTIHDVHNPLTPQGHKVFVYEYIQGLRGEDSAIPSVTFQILGEILDGFLNGTGKWSQTHLYQSMQRAKNEGNHLVEYAILRDLIDTVSYTMSDNRYLALAGSMEDLHSHYFRTLADGEEPGTFSDFVLAVGEKSLLGHYFDFWS